MKVRTIAAGGAVAILAYGGLQLIQGDLPRQQSSSTRLAKPRKFRLDEHPESRGRVILQVCWYPGDKTTMSVTYQLGSGGTKADRVGPPLTCATPWQRMAVLGNGDRVTLGWTIVSGPVGKVKYRITINNRARVADENGSARNTFIYSCVVGTPPCELP